MLAEAVRSWILEERFDKLVTRASTILRMKDGLKMSCICTFVQPLRIDLMAFPAMTGIRTATEDLGVIVDRRYHLIGDVRSRFCIKFPEVVLDTVWVDGWELSKSIRGADH